jgi:integrase
MPVARDVPVAAGASRPADAGAARASGDSGQGPAMPATTAHAGIDYVIDDLLDDEPNPSPLPAYAAEIFGMSQDHVHELLWRVEEYLAMDAASRQARLNTPPSQRTIKLYGKKMQSMVVQFNQAADYTGDLAVDLLATYARSKETFKVMKAALKWHLMRRIQFRVAELRKLALVGEPLPAHSYLSMEAAFNAVRRLGPLIRTTCLALAQQTSNLTGSTRSTPKALTNGERERFLLEVERSPTYRLAGVVLNFCGMRPEELHKGVEIEWLAPGSLLVNIRGAKVRKGISGQRWRRMRLKAEALPNWFVNHVHDNKAVTVTAEPDAMRAYLGRLSPVVLGLPRNGKAPRLSAYAFRHALVTDLRDEGRTTEEIAAVIGELSAETVAYYGLHRRGRGKFRPRVAIERDSVQTADAVKPLNRSGLQAVLYKKAQSSSKLKPRLA